MRISETKVVQFIEAEPPFLVLADDTTGEEMKLSVDEVRLLGQSLHYFGPALGLGLK